MEINWPSKAELKKSTQAAILASSKPCLVHPPQNQANKPHLLVCADNLVGMPALEAAGEAFDFIYIDPPYNTGQNFSFSDKRSPKPSASETSEDSWLHFMMPRLMWAHHLLIESGVIFVSIDDRQMASLQLLMVEIFGKPNHIATFKWKKKRKPSFLSKHVSTVVEYILVFSKDSSKLPKFLGEPSQDTTRPVLNASNGMSSRILRAGTQAKCEDGVYVRGEYTNRSLGFELQDEMVVQNGLVVHDVSLLGRFRVDQALLDRSVFVTRNFGLRRRVDPSEMKFKHVTDDCHGWPTNEDADAETKSIFGSRVFEYAKPIGMLTRLLEMCPVKPGQEFNCLDFFAGTGTLGEAVVRVNAQDGLRRRFVCLQSNEELKVKKGALPSQWKTIFDLTKYRTVKACQEFGDLRNVELLSLRSVVDIPLEEPQMSGGATNHAGILDFEAKRTPLNPCVDLKGTLFDFGF